MDTTIIDVISNATALGLLGLVLYFGYSLLRDLVALLDRHLTAIEQDIDEIQHAIEQIAEKYSQ